MKKIIVLLLACLMISMFSFPRDRFFSLEQALSSRIPSKINDDQKNWLLGLSAFVMQINKCSHTTLEVKPFSKDAKKTYKNILKNGWGINNRKELIEAITKLEKNGHNAQYQKLRRLLKSNPDKTIEYVSAMYKLSPREKNYYMFLKHFDSPASPADIMSWDIGRAASLVRWGYQVGYLTRAEAWNILAYLGHLVKAKYNSWGDYGNSHAYGRLLWASGFGETPKYYIETKQNLEILFSENGLWNKLHWRWNFTDFQWYVAWKIRNWKGGLCA